MQKWEYMTLQTFAGEWVDGNGRTGKHRGRLQQLLNEFGAQGWELRTMIMDPSIKAEEWVFARPVD